MIQIAALLVSYIPSILIYFFLRNIRKEKEYRSTCRKLILRGMLTTTGVVLFSLVCSLLWASSGLSKVNRLLSEAFRTFILASLSEETMKYLSASKTVKKEKATVSWLDEICWFGIVGIGFNLFESFAYMFTTNVIEILVRGITGLHTAYALFMGYYMGKYQRTKERKYWVLGFFFPVFLHGLYDFSLSDDLLEINDNFVFLPFIVIAVSLYILIHMLLLVKKARTDPEYTKPLFGQATEESGTEESVEQIR